MKGSEKNPNFESQRAPIELIIRASERMEKLIANNLDVVKVEAGMFVIEPLPDGIESLIHETVDLLKAEATEKTINIEVEISPGCSQISAIIKECFKPFLT